MAGVVMRASDVTITDLFCGAGGSSIGATRSGGRLRMALNHWQLAIETHNSNFPCADHDCTDVSACNPRRYPSTTILLASPECTSHSLAKGRRRKAVGQGDIFRATSQDPADIRSRATMWDVPRFAETHGYDLVIVENVVDAAMHWDPFPAWLHAMQCLGYEHRICCINSMHAHPTPQSRDRLYVVFWRRGNRAPDLEWRPRAWCAHCERDCEGVQSWKPGRTVGRYRKQYIFCCPTCGREVEPYYYAAVNALDFGVPAVRIGDRKHPLKPRTIERIRYGLDRYGRRPLVVRTTMTSGIGCRVRDATIAPPDTQPGCGITALVHPFIVDVARGHAHDHKTRDITRELPTQTGRQTQAIVTPAFLMGTLATRDRHALVAPETESVDVDDCYFRMLTPDEVGAGMAFPSDYVVLGNKRDRVKQFGNAVTPPAMEWLVRRCVESLAGER